MTKWRRSWRRLSQPPGAAIGLACGYSWSSRADRPRLAVLLDLSRAVSRGTSRRSPASLPTEGHEPRILAPFDPRRPPLGAAAPRRAPAAPAGARGLRLARAHRSGSRPTARSPTSPCTPHAVAALRRELRDGRLRRRPHPRAGRAAASAGTRSARRGELPLVGTFHTYSENALTNGIAAVPLGGRRRMNRLHVRIAVSEAAAWTARASSAATTGSSPTACTCSRAPRAAGRGADAARAAHPVHRPGGRAQGPAGAAARVRGAARARPGDADARRRERRGGRAT